MAKIGGGTWDLVAADDPSDWKEDFSFLKTLDSGLRCDLCFDIFTAPVSIKDCNHTFCSACVRNAINKPGEEMSGRCPKCMNKNVYDSSLLPQPALENVALQWRNARSQLYNMQQARLQEQAARASSSSNKETNGKRGRDEADLSSSPSSPHLRRSKRSTSARKAGTPSYVEHVTIDDSSQDEFEDIQNSDPESKTPDQHSNNPETQQNISDTKDYRQIGASDVVQCPLCQHTFTYRALNIHLDKGTCSPDDPEPSPQERGLTAPKSGNTASSWLASSGRSNVLASSSPAGSTNRPIGGSSNGLVKEDRRKKLVRPTYDILKTNDIKKLLRDWQLNCAGTDRKRMVERHRKWINLYNANLDASEQVRKSNVVLRKELEQWERAQDEVSSGLSEKRAKTWAMDHKTDFAALARLARETHIRDRSKHVEEKKAEQALGSDGQQPVSVTSDPSIHTAISHEEILQENKETK